MKKKIIIGCSVVLVAIIALIAIIALRKVSIYEAIQEDKSNIYGISSVASKSDVVVKQTNIDSKIDTFQMDIEDKDDENVQGILAILDGTKYRSSIKNYGPFKRDKISKKNKDGYNVCINLIVNKKGTKAITLLIADDCVLVSNNDDRIYYASNKNITKDLYNYIRKHGEKLENDLKNEA